MLEYLVHQQATLGYHKIGHGKKVLLLFHGYGQHGKVFEENSRAIANEYTCYLFNLFFHEDSTWGYGEDPLTPEFWNSLMTKFLESQQVNRFTLAGFSLGGRFVFATLTAFADRIDGVHLLAPDGVKTNFWYNLATYPVALRKVFKGMVLHPSRFYTLAHAVHRLGFVDKGLIRFAESQMKTEEMRKRVYYSWVVFRKLKFDMEEIAQLIRRRAIPTTLVLGTFDKVITTTNMRRLLRHLPECQVELLDTGHNGIIGRWKPGNYRAKSS